MPASSSTGKFMHITGLVTNDLGHLFKFFGGSQRLGQGAVRRPHHLPFMLLEPLHPLCSAISGAQFFLQNGQMRALGAERLMRQAVRGEADDDHARDSRNCQMISRE
jgi:hypothetical protein